MKQNYEHQDVHADADQIFGPQSDRQDDHANPVLDELDSIQDELSKIRQTIHVWPAPSNSIFESVICSISDGLAISDHDGNLVIVNVSLRNMLSLDSQSSLEAIKEKLINAGLKRALVPEATGPGEFIFKSEGGRVVRAKWSNQTDASGSPFSVIIFNDITEQLETDRVQSEFIAAISHELRTPLTTIQNAVSNLLAGVAGKPNSKTQEYLVTMEMDCHRLAHLINDLLDMAKLELGKMPINRRAVNLAELIEKAGRIFASGLKEKNINFQICCDKNLPRGYIDPQRLLQVLCNLLSNALKYTNAGGNITVSVLENLTEFIVVVEDTGIGIEPERIRNIFKKFYQVGRQAGPGYNGTGLGLALCSEIVALHGGKIWVDSQPEKGSKFQFSIPKTSSEVMLQKHLTALSERAAKLNNPFALFIIRLEAESDQLGMEKGMMDTCMQEISKSLEQTASMNEDIVIKNNDHEVTLVLNQSGKRYLKFIKKRISAVILENLTKSYFTRAKIMPMLGMAVYPYDTTDLQELQTKARRDVNRLL